MANSLQVVTTDPTSSPESTLNNAILEVNLIVNSNNTGEIRFILWRDLSACSNNKKSLFTQSIYILGQEIVQGGITLQFAFSDIENLSLNEIPQWLKDTNRKIMIGNNTIDLSQAIIIS